MKEFVELQEHLDILKENEDHISYFNELAKSLLRTDPDYVKHLMESILAIANEKNYIISKAWCCIWLGWFYFDISNYDKAIELHTEGNRIFTEYGNAEGVIYSCNALLSDYTQIGLYDMSIEWGLLGITTAEKEKIYSSIPALLVNTAVAYIDLGAFTEAKELLEQLNVLPYQISLDTRIIWHQAMANVELHFENLPEAALYAEGGTEIAKLKGYDLLVPQMLLVGAQVKGKQGRDKEAVEDFETALELALKINDMDLSSTILLKWAKYQISVNDYEGALFHLHEARGIAEKTKSKRLLLEINKDLCDIYKLLGNFERSLEYLELHSACQKDIFNHASCMTLAKMKNDQAKRQASIYKSLYDQSALISKIGRELTSNLNLDSILDDIYEEVNGLMGAQIFGIALYKEEKDTLDFSLFIENDKRVDMGCVSVSDETSIGAYCFRNKTDIIINDTSREYIKYVSRTSSYKSTEKTPLSLIFCPLIIGDRALGIIGIQSYNKNAYSLNDLNIIKALSSYVAIAIENASLFNKIQKMANYDHLTGVLNRREIFKNGEISFYKYKKYGENICIAMIDIDRFKKINDVFGHNAGDVVVTRVSEIIKTSIRESDFVGRYGGDEFLVVLPKTTIEEAYHVMDRLRRAIEKCEIPFNGTSIVNLTISVGIFEVNKETLTFNQGVDASDRELYKAKNAGKNTIMCAS